MDFNSLVMHLIRNNPQIANNPNAQEMLNTIQSGDSQKGQQIAKNLCQTYGITPEQALQRAKQFFRV